MTVIPRKQRLRWATPQTSTLDSYTKENPYIGSSDQDYYIGTPKGNPYISNPSKRLSAKPMSFFI